MSLGRAYCYARWDGTQTVDPFDPAALFDVLAAMSGVDTEVLA